MVIAVADNGPGIPAEQREKIFVPFYTTKRQGSGVGLTLVRQIATVHGATVSISQTPGGGATISLRFSAISAQRIVLNGLRCWAARRSR